MASSIEKRPSRSIPHIAGLATLLLVAGALEGCTPKPPTTTSQVPPTPSEVMDRMRAAYRSTPAYEDAGQLELRYVQGAGTRPQEKTFPFSCAFERPNRLRLHVFDAVVVSDGEKFQASIGELPDQVLSLPAKARLNVADIHADPILATILTSLVGGSVQLRLLLEEDPLAALLERTAPSQSLEVKNVGDTPCFRITYVRDDGDLVFWVDQKSYALLRLDYPAQAVREAIGATESVSQLSLSATFTAARLGGSIKSDAFRFEAPENCRLVTRFDNQQPPQPPSEDLGKKLASFDFALPSGERVTNESLAGKVVVVDFWGTQYAPCHDHLLALETVFRRYKDRDDVAFYAVSLDSPEVTDADLREVLKRMKVTIPLARDPNEFARTSFDVQGVPNLCILGPDGVLEDNEVGINPLLDTELPQRLDKILSGKSIVEDCRARFQQRLAEYELAIRSQSPSELSPSTPQVAKISPATVPTRLAITRKWLNTELAQPGNLLVTTDADGRTELLALDGYRQVAVMDLEGTVLARHELDIPSDQAVSYVRSAVDSAGKRYFAASASHQKQVHLFDENWRRLWSHPESTTAGITDVVFADINADGSPELGLAYADVVGVHLVDLQGKRLWALRRSLVNVLSLALAGAESGTRGLIAVDGRGALIPITPDGEAQAPNMVDQRFVRLVVGADLDGDEVPEHCGVTAAPEGQESLIGIGGDGSMLWSYPLPAGAPSHPGLEMITSGRLIVDGKPAETANWIVAGVDGSIHFIGPDGTVIDWFAYGQAVTGLSTTMAADGKPLLLVASPQGLEALAVE